MKRLPAWQHSLTGNANHLSKENLEKREKTMNFEQKDLKSFHYVSESAENLATSLLELIPDFKSCDSPILFQLAENLVHLSQLNEQIENLHGEFLVTSERGSVGINPLLRHRQNVEKVVQTLADQLLINPKMRSKLSIDYLDQLKRDSKAPAKVPSFLKEHYNK